jgi:hypothetical protein
MTLHTIIGVSMVEKSGLGLASGDIRGSWKGGLALNQGKWRLARFVGTSL